MTNHDSDLNQSRIMPPKFPWFPCYVSDWLGSSRIAAMTAAQEGAYHRLLCLAWSDKQCSLPADRTQLASMSKLPQGQLDPVLACFEPHPTLPQRIHNVRLTEEWEKAEQFHQTRSDSGAMGALKRWHGSTIASPIAPLKRGNSLLQSQSQSQPQKEIKTPDKSVVTSRLEDRTTKGFEHVSTSIKDVILARVPKDSA